MACEAAQSADGADACRCVVRGAGAACSSMFNIAGQCLHRTSTRCLVQPPRRGSWSPNKTAKGLSNAINARTIVNHCEDKMPGGWNHNKTCALGWEASNMTFKVTMPCSMLLRSDACELTMR